MGRARRMPSAAAADAEMLVANDLALQLGAGNIDIVVMKAARKGALQVGTGNIKVRLLDISEDVTMKSGLGNIDVNMAAQVSQYDVNAESALGNISVIGDSYFSPKNKVIRRGTGEKQLKLETGVGMINVEKTGEYSSR